MMTQKKTTTTTFQYDETIGRMIEEKVVEETEIPKIDLDLDEGILIETEGGCEYKADPLDIIYGVAGIMAVIASGVAIFSALRK